MSLQKFQEYSKKTHICNKCGSIMHKRKLHVTKSKTLKIIQCSVCKHWITLKTIQKKK